MTHSLRKKRKNEKKRRILYIYHLLLPWLYYYFLFNFLTCTFYFLFVFWSQFILFIDLHSCLLKTYCYPLRVWNMFWNDLFIKWMKIYWIPTISHTNILGAGDTIVTKKDKCSYSGCESLEGFYFFFFLMKWGVSFFLSYSTWQL